MCHSEDAEGGGECEDQEEHPAQDEDTSLRQVVGEVRASDDRRACCEEVAGRRARAHAERVARGAKRDGRELAAVADLGDDGEGEGLDHQRPAALELRAARLERLLGVLTLLVGVGVGVRVRRVRVGSGVRVTLNPRPSP